MTDTTTEAPTATHWDYRVTRCRSIIGGVDFGYTYEVREVYYRDDRVIAWSDDPSAPQGDSDNDLLANIELFREAVTDRPILDITDRIAKDVEEP